MTTHTDGAEADLNHRLVQQRREHYGLPPIPPQRHAASWAIEGWGGYALGVILVLTAIVMGAW